MRRVKTYVVLRDFDLDNFMIEVDKPLDEGLIPCGGISITTVMVAEKDGSQASMKILYAQAFTSQKLDRTPNPAG